MREFAQPISVEEALRGDGIAIEVPEGEALVVGFFSDAYPEAYRVAQVRGFEELQALGLIPNGVTERDVTEAVTADDLLFQEVQARVLGMPGAARREAAPVLGGTLSRRRTQTHLSQALATSLGRAGRGSSVDVIHAYGHLRRWIDRVGPILIGVELANNIVVNAGALLVMSPTVQLLNADVITIKSAGTLRFDAGSVHVRCATLNGWDGIGPDYTLEPPPIKFTIPDYLIDDPILHTVRRYLPGMAAERQLYVADAR